MLMSSAEVFAIRQLSDDLQNMFAKQASSSSQVCDEELSFLKSLCDLIRQNERLVMTSSNLMRSLLMCLFPLGNSKCHHVAVESFRITRLLVHSSSVWNEMMLLRYDISFMRILFQPNRFEKEFHEVICILGKVVRICSHLIPYSIIKSLCITCRDIPVTKNKYKRTLLGILSILVVQYPHTAKCINIYTPLIQIGFINHLNPLVIESSIHILMSIYENPNLRTEHYSKGLVECLLLPYTDPHYVGSPEFHDPSNPSSLKELCNTTTVAILSLFKSWAGITIMLDSNKGLKSLLDVLPHSSSFIRMSIIQLLCRMLNIKVDFDSEDFSDMLASMGKYKFSHLNTDLSASYVVGELLSIFKPVRPQAIDVVELQQAFLVRALFDFNIVNVLLKTVSLSKEQNTKSAAILLLGELLHRYYCFVPLKLRTIDYLDEILQLYVEDLNAQDVCSESRYVVSRLSEHSRWANSINLTQFISSIAFYVIGSGDESCLQPGLPNCEVLDQHDPAGKEGGEINKRIEDTQVLTQHNDSWLWDKISAIFCVYPFLLVDKNSNSQLHRFMQNLRDFYMPHKQKFMMTKVNKMEAKLISSTMVKFIRCLLNPNQSNEGMQWVNDLLKSLNDILKSFKPEGAFKHPESRMDPYNSVTFRHFYSLFDEYLAREYFVLIGLTQSSKIGQAFLDSSLILNNLYTIFEESPPLEFIVAVLPCLNYGHTFSRKFIGIVICSKNDEAKIYCMNFILVLFHLQDPNSMLWSVTYLVKLLFDPSEYVAAKAADMLDEIIDLHLEVAVQVVNMKLPYLSLGANGIKIATRLISTFPIDSVGLQLSNQMLKKLGDRWCNSYISTYRRSLEENLFETFSSYGKCSNTARQSASYQTESPQFYINPYKLERIVSIDQLRSMLKFPVCNSEEEADSIKDCLLFIANYAVTSLGINKVLRACPDVFQKIINLVYECNFLSVRWIGIIALNLMSKNKIGAEVLRTLQWFSLDQSPFPEVVPQKYKETVSVKPESTTKKHSIKRNRLNKAGGKVFSVSSIDQPEYHRIGDKSERSHSLYRTNSVVSSKASYADFIGYGTRYTDSQYFFTTEGYMMGEAAASIFHRPARGSFSQESIHKSTDDVFALSLPKSASVGQSMAGHVDAFLKFDHCETEMQIFKMPQKRGRTLCLPDEVSHLFKVTYYRPPNKPDLRPGFLSLSTPHNNFSGTEKASCIKCSLLKATPAEEGVLASCSKLGNDTRFDHTMKTVSSPSGSQSEAKNYALIVSAFFNIFSPNLLEESMKVVDDVRCAQPEIFKSNCLMVHLLDMLLLSDARVKTFQYTYYNFEDIEWIPYYMMAQENINAFLEQNKNPAI